MAAPALTRDSFLYTWVEEQQPSVIIDTSMLEERRVQNTLHKIENGTFGRCLMCGGSIDPDLLAEQPWAKRCGSCREPAPVIPFRRRERAEIDQLAA
jgi:hypothetical protein